MPRKDPQIYIKLQMVGVDMKYDKLDNEKILDIPD